MERILSSQTLDKVGQVVTLMGWVDTIRHHGGINFIDLRDRQGIIQIVGGEDLRRFHPEDVISVTGQVLQRQDDTVNPKIATGHIEVKANSIKLLNHSQTIPFPIDTNGYQIEEDLRLKYRYVDLRRSRLQANLRLRSRYIQALRQYLFDKDFVEIETPLLTKSTPEGSRDFVVPSRNYPGKFYALPQSPQQYKQLLMTGGFERYFQVARCLRDEDPRADRAFEHTQLDMEMSFVDRQDVMSTVEGMVTSAVEAVGGHIAQKPFPVITYQEALSQYHADKFDPRTPEQKDRGELGFAWVVNFPFFEKDAEGKWTFTHNPFSSPIPEHEQWLLNQEHIDEIITNQYDLVCNGYEVGGGSIRSHEPEVLKAVFKIMGYQEADIQTKFGHMLDAFSLGTPPHGGCAHGVERLLMILQGETSIHEVQAFPQTSSGRTSVMDAPSLLDPVQLTELNLQVVDKTYASVFDHLVDLLNSHQIKYQLYEHEPVYTSEQAAQVRGDVNLHQGAKALVLQADHDYILYVLPGDERADLKNLKNFLKVKRLAMASAESVQAKTGLTVGAIPPFGSVWGVSTYLAPSLGDNQEVVFNAGRHDRSIKINYRDYLKLEKPILVEVS